MHRILEAITVSFGIDDGPEDVAGAVLLVVRAVPALVADGSHAVDDLVV